MKTFFALLAFITTFFFAAFTPAFADDSKSAEGSKLAESSQSAKGSKSAESTKNSATEEKTEAKSDDASDKTKKEGDEEEEPDCE